MTRAQKRSRDRARRLDARDHFRRGVHDRYGGAHILIMPRTKGARVCWEFERVTVFDTCGPLPLVDRSHYPVI